MKTYDKDDAICINCRFYEKWGSGADGQCRRNPPTFDERMWPHTFFDMFCGEFKK